MSVVSCRRTGNSGGEIIFEAETFSVVICWVLAGGFLGVLGVEYVKMALWLGEARI